VAVAKALHAAELEWRRDGDGDEGGLDTDLAVVLQAVDAGVREAQRSEHDIDVAVAEALEAAEASADGGSLIDLDAAASSLLLQVCGFLRRADACPFQQCYSQRPCACLKFSLRTFNVGVLLGKTALIDILRSRLRT
jgi:hypothetical protein